MKRRALLLCCALAASTASLGAQDQQSARPVRPRSLAEDLQLFSQVLNQIRVNHPDSVDTHRLLMSAVEGLVQAADPHSFVIPAVRLDSARRGAWIDGKLYPILVDFRFLQGAPLVVAVTPGSRASRLDIMVGDELTEIDGKPVSVQSPDELAYTLAGAKGTSVKLGLERRRADGSIVQLERLVPRERSDDVTAVPVAVMLDSSTGYVRVTTFSGDKVADDLNAPVERLEKRGLKRLILDLRDNGGGRVDQAKSIAGAFLPRGTVVYTIASPKRDLVDTGRVSRSFWRSERKYPLVVMVNSGTASASELVAGALQDHDRAIVVGHTSFGKALVMQTVPLSDGSLMMLVVGRVFTPCGRVVQREYRGFSQRHYLRTAGASLDTVGRPSCLTASGRKLYGGGGIVPDVILPERTVPAWLTRLAEGDALLTWSSGYAGAHAAELVSLDRFAVGTVGQSAVADFRTFASTRGISVPADSSSAELLERALRRFVAYAKWGEEGIYRVVTLTDPEISAAVRAFR